MKAEIVTNLEVEVLMFTPESVIDRQRLGKICQRDKGEENFDLAIPLKETLGMLVGI